MSLPRGRLSIMLASVLCLVGCKAKPEANGLFHVSLQTDWYPQPEMGGFYEAQLEGLYKAQGLEVTILPGGPTLVATQQVLSDKAQFAMGSSDSVLVDRSRDLPVVAICATMQQDPQGVMVHESSPVHSFADLDHRAIAVKPGSIWFQYLVKRYNLGDVQEIPATFSVATFLNDPNYIQQAFVTSEPFFARQAGSAVRTLLVSSTEYQPYRVTFTSKQFLAEHPEIVERFVKASVQGWKDYLTDPTKVNAAIGRLNPAMSADQMKFSYDTLKAGHFLDGPGTSSSHLGHFTAERWETTYKQLVDLGVAKPGLDPRDAYTTRFIP